MSANRRWLAEQVRPVRWLTLVSVVAGLIVGAAIIVQFGLMATLVHGAIIEDQSLDTLTPLVMGILAAIVLRAAAESAQGVAGARAAERVQTRLREQLLQSWSRTGPVGLSGTSPGSLASEWLEQVDALEGYIARYRPQMLLAVLVPLLIVVVVLRLDWVAAVFLLVSAPLIPLFMALVGMGAEKLNQQHFESLSRLAGHFLDRVRGLTTLQLFNRTDQALADVAEASDTYRRLNMRTLRVAFLSSAVLEFFASVAIAVVAIYIGFGLLGFIEFGGAPDLTLFSGLFILLLAPEFFQPLRTLAQHYHDRAAALGAADHLRQRLGGATEEEQADAGITTSGPEDRIDVQRLTIAYPERGAVVSNLTFSLAGGETLALTGPSGCGKSSVLNVLAGFQRPEAGSVSVFGEAPGHSPVAWLNQHPFLIAGSWADNLRLVHPHADEATMRHAVEQAGLGAVLARQPDGLDTQIGEDGRGLSGGQGHRLALARVFLSDVRLVLLDEPTAGLDPETRFDVIEALKLLCASDRAVIMATHQPEVMAMADRCLSLADDGGVDHE